MKKGTSLILVAVILLLSFTLTACHGMIPPVIGEKGQSGNGNDEQTTPASAATEGTEPAGDPGAPAGDNQSGGEGEQSSGGGNEGGDNQSGGEGSGGPGNSEPVVATEMTGNVVYRFYHEETKTTSLGALEEFTAEAMLYDTMNADGINGYIHLQSGSSEDYMTFVWTANEDGTLTLQQDEFNVFEAREVEGVLTIVGIRYSLGMMNSGVVDIPLAK